jgi:hypothetical protein
VPQANAKKKDYFIGGRAKFSAAPELEGRKTFFFEKKNQKTFAPGVRQFAQRGGTCAGRNE